MRYFNVLLLLVFVVLILLTAVMTLPCVEMLLRPTDASEQLQTLLKPCQDTLTKLRDRYGDIPVAEWSSEADKQTYTNAQRILEEMAVMKPCRRAYCSSW